MYPSDFHCIVVFDIMTYRKLTLVYIYFNSILSVHRDKTGAPIQCSVKTCKTAFHVTCAFSQGYDMKTVVEESDDAVMLQ